jgi:mRNA-degrading endonuclease toxin of MazEF toxin-antitoxin module
MSALDRQYPIRGEIWWAHFPFDPPEKTRPAIIVSANGRNSHPRSNTVLAIPLSTSIHKQSPGQLLLHAGETGLRSDCMAWAEDIGTITKDQLKAPVSGHRPLTHTQICKLASLVKIAMGCVE